MRRAFPLQCLCGALLLTWCLTIPAVPPALAGKGKSQFHTLSGKHGFVTRGSKFSQKGLYRHGRFKPHKGRGRVVLLKRHHAKRHYVFLPRYGFNDRRGTPIRGYPTATSPRRGYATTVTESDGNRSVTPKWIHLGDLDEGEGPHTGAGTMAPTDAGANCLNVRTEITVDGQPMEAFGEACLEADGTWQLVPTK